MSIKRRRRPLLESLVRAGMLFSAVVMLSSGLVFGQTEVVEFSDESLRPRYLQLIEELRCPKCQNQNLADSNSAISVDLRLQIQSLLEQQNSNAEIKSYLTERYSDFILYRPLVDRRTLFLWAAPIFFILSAAMAMVLLLRRQRRMSDYPSNDSQIVISDSDKQRLAQLLNTRNDLR